MGWSWYFVRGSSEEKAWNIEYRTIGKLLPVCIGIGMALCEGGSSVAIIEWRIIFVRVASIASN
jgi:hypothetical protein